jgi:hypothetical protein
LANRLVSPQWVRDELCATRLQGADAGCIGSGGVGEERHDHRLSAGRRGGDSVPNAGDADDGFVGYAGGSRCGRPGSISGLSTLGDTRGCRRLCIFQPRLSRGLEGPCRPDGHAPTRREQSPDASHFRDLRDADVTCRCEGRGGEAEASNSNAHRRRRSGVAARGALAAAFST